MIKILLADDHGIVRGGVKRLFALTSDISVVAEASEGKQVLGLLRQSRFDVILLDLSMPNISGVSLISRIRSSHPDLPILILSMHNEPQIAWRALKAGATGYLSKDNEPETLLQAVRRVAEGKRFIDPLLAEQMIFDTFDSELSKVHEKLTGREYQILLLLSRGKSLNDIAQELSISNKTVSTHKMRLMKKMGFASNAELVRFAVTQGLVE